MAKVQIALFAYFFKISTDVKNVARNVDTAKRSFAIGMLSFKCNFCDFRFVFIVLEIFTNNFFRIVYIFDANNIHGDCWRIIETRLCCVLFCKWSWHPDVQKRCNWSGDKKGETWNVKRVNCKSAQSQILIFVWIFIIILFVHLFWLMLRYLLCCLLLLKINFYGKNANIYIYICVAMFLDNLWFDTYFRHFTKN